MTERLFDINSYIMEFTAQVLSCEKSGDGYAVILDRTAFFPDAGGQPHDTGTVGAIPVTDVQIHNGIIVHTTPAPLVCGETVYCKIDRDKRFYKMQNHTGEHIISALMHRRFGLTNVGFHMGSRDVTADFDGVISPDAILDIETESNRIVWENVPVTACYPSPEELKATDYRSKLDITENVRIVSVGDYDKCACCAPHVHSTGEIGSIRITDYYHYKGGMRLHLLCGADALEYDRMNSRIVNDISVLLSSKPENTGDAVLQLFNESKRLKAVINAQNSEINRLICEGIPENSGARYIFDTRTETETLRRLASAVSEKCGDTAGVFGGTDNSGYKYVIYSLKGGLKVQAARFNSAVNGRGGGSDEMLCGSVSCPRGMIEAAFNKLFKVNGNI